MDTRVKQLWLDALRSGEYKQGKYHLCDDTDGIDKFCCLGVLTDLYLQEQNAEWGTANECFKHRVDLPDDVCKWSRLDIDPKTNGRYLSELNDNGYFFTEIADLIEEHL